MFDIKIKKFNIKKKIFIILFILFSLLTCTFLTIRYINKRKIEITRKEFKKIVDDFKIKKNDLIKKEKLFFKKQNNIYSHLIGLNLAKNLFFKKKYKESIKILKEILVSTSDINLINFIKLNLVKIYIKKKKFSLALKIIHHIDDDIWKSLFNKYKKYITSHMR
ncbi:tetratricopeptide repeat protein [Buchnera aphidicola]|uniref:Conserved protein n=1 Tax=Buchnera aphidicola subsp. Cinara cedri (strain Cc) TaxID=372461 RepID=Q056V6_BUCCC|nr:tetratricopeptide repeat protein [Buchnera aphidicola]ABJ90843.1 conserved protein [Buchnera aphidicola BCc]